MSAPFTGLTAYAAGTGGRVAYTDMGGTLWYDRSVGAATTLRSLQSPSASTVYAAGEDGKVYRSFLSGQGGTWQAMTPPAAPGGIAFTGPGYGWCVNGGIFYTEDSASTWTRSPEHTRWTLRSVWMNGSGTGYAAGDNGTILRTLTGGR
ncbi:TPA: hypothetical protein HA259_05360 [Thermoplasmata archaeon]|nr:hypothetical protein [Thermoplasmata archaeon]